MPSPNTSFVLPGRVRALQEGKSRGRGGGGGGGRGACARPSALSPRPLALSGVFLPPSPPRRQMPAGKLWPPSHWLWGESQSPVFGLGVGREPGLRGESLSESVTGLSGLVPRAAVSSWSPRPGPGGIQGGRKGMRRVCLDQLGRSSSAFGLLFGKGLGISVSRVFQLWGSVPQMRPQNSRPVQLHRPENGPRRRERPHLLIGRAESHPEGTATSSVGVCGRFPPLPGLKPDIRHPSSTETHCRGTLGKPQRNEGRGQEVSNESQFQSGCLAKPSS